MKFFYLQKSDRHIIIISLVIIGAALAVIYFTDNRQETLPIAEQQKTKEQPRKGKKQYYQQQKLQEEGELFTFDPNSADSTQLLRLGLKPFQVRNIYKYRQAGGIFRNPHDFAKLYGLTVKQYRRLEPYIRISDDYLPAASLFHDEQPAKVRDTLRYPVKLKVEERMVLNLADTASLRKIPGIGPYFARKIVEYRRRLGGFYSVRQLLEIEDFPEKAIDYFIIPDSTLPQHHLNVNKMSLNELKRHPYINFYQAKAITLYRRTKGPLKSLQELSLLNDFPPEAIKRLEPYVSY